MKAFYLSLPLMFVFHDANAQNLNDVYKHNHCTMTSAVAYVIKQSQDDGEALADVYADIEGYAEETFNSVYDMEKGTGTLEEKQRLKEKSIKNYAEYYIKMANLIYFDDTSGHDRNRVRDKYYAACIQR